MASNLVVARGGVEFVHQFHLHFGVGRLFFYITAITYLTLKILMLLKRNIESYFF